MNATIRCKCGETIDVTDCLNSDLRLIADHQAVRIDELEASVMSLRAIIDAKLHRRKCRTCGHVGYYADGVVPYCLCEKCKSQDTRRMKE